jgi:hypothetical protein
MSFLRRQRRKRGTAAPKGAYQRGAALRPYIKLRSREEVTRGVASNDRGPPQPPALKDRPAGRSEIRSPSSPPLRRVQISETVPHPQREVRKEPVEEAQRALQERVARGRSPGLSR